MAFQSRAKKNKETWVQGLSCAELLLPPSVLLLWAAHKRSSPREKQCSEGKDEHFSPTGCAEGVEEAGRLCCLMPIILLSIEVSTRWEWKRMGAHKKTLFSLCPSWKAKSIFFFYVIMLTQREWIAWQRWQAQIHHSCSRDGHTKLCSSSPQRLVTPGTRTTNQRIQIMLYL